MNENKWETKNWCEKESVSKGWNFVIYEVLDRRPVLKATFVQNTKKLRHILNNSPTQNFQKNQNCVPVLN